MKYNRCNKKNCGCQKGEKHGPYYYLREYIKGKGSKDTYIGRKLPPGCYYDERVDLIRIISKEFDLPRLKKELKERKN